MYLQCTIGKKKKDSTPSVVYGGLKGKSRKNLDEVLPCSTSKMLIEKSASWGGNRF